MNNLLISGMVCWETDKTSKEAAINELFEAIVKSGLPIDIDITYDASLLDEDGIDIDLD